MMSALVEDACNVAVPDNKWNIGIQFKGTEFQSERWDVRDIDGRVRRSAEE
jgi:hypothetical protein